MKSLVWSGIFLIFSISAVGCATQPTTKQSGSSQLVVHQSDTNKSLNSSKVSDPRPHSKKVQKSDSNWVYLGTTSNSILSIDKTSFDIDKTNGGKYAINMIIQRIDKNNKKVHFNKIYITAKSCGRGYGKLVFLTLEGNYITEIDYVKNGSSVASKVADILCKVTKSVIKEVKRNKKEI